MAFRNALSPCAQQDRTELAIAATNAALGQAVGQLYTQRYFSPQDKAKAKAMVDNLLLAFRQRIANRRWMSDETKQKALTKLAAFKLDIGYPDKWIDYSGLEIVPGDALGTPAAERHNSIIGTRKVENGDPEQFLEPALEAINCSDGFAHIVLGRLGRWW